MRSESIKQPNAYSIHWVLKKRRDSVAFISSLTLPPSRPLSLWSHSFLPHCWVRRDIINTWRATFSLWALTLWPGGAGYHPVLILPSQVWGQDPLYAKPWPQRLFQRRDHNPNLTNHGRCRTVARAFRKHTFSLCSGINQKMWENKSGVSHSYLHTTEESWTKNESACRKQRQ